MAALRAFLGGLFGLVIGAVGSAFISDIIMGWAGVSDFEGGRGMAAVFVFGPIGGLVGLALGIWLGLRIGRRRAVAGEAAAPSHWLRNAAIAVAGIIAVAGVILAVQYYSIPHHLEYDDASANLAFELRAPAARAQDLDRAAIEVSLDTDLNQQPGFWEDEPARIDGEWAVLSGEVELYYRTAQRLLVFRLPDGRDLIFDPDLPAKPDPEQGWSEWRKVNFVGLPDRTDTVRPGPEEPYELRYRIRVWGTE